MKDWKFPRLSEIAIEARGNADIVSGKFYQSWSIPSYAVGNAEIVDGETIKSAKRLVSSGDVLLCKINPRINRVWVVGESNGLPQVASTEWIAIRPIDRSVIYPRFLREYFASPSFREWINNETTGATGSHTRAKPQAVWKQKIPLPPLAEQKRIVAILDEAFAAIDRAKEIAQKKVKTTDHFQMSVYRAAFTGKLVDTVDQFDSIKMTKAASTTRGRPATDRIIMGEYALSVGKPNVCPPDGWRWLELTSIAKLESGHTPSRRHPEYWGGDVPWIGIKDARDHHGGTITKTREYTNVIGIQNSAARLLPSGTVCLSRTASVGYVVVMGTEMATSQDFVNWVCSDQLDPHFLRYLFIAENQAYRKFSSGAVHQTIYFPEVKAFHVCIPSRSIQRQIVDTLDTILESTRRVVEIYGKQSALLNDLKQSILHKAFTGQLTAKSPELEAIP